MRFFAKYASSSKWEEADMRPEPGGSAYQFLIAGVPETLEYYVEAGGVRSTTYKLNVVDLPSVKKIRSPITIPSWSGMKDAVEDPGGDLRAVEGTIAEVAVADRPAAGERRHPARRRHQAAAARQGADGALVGQRADPEGRPCITSPPWRAAKTCA